MNPKRIGLFCSAAVASGISYILLDIGNPRVPDEAKTYKTFPQDKPYDQPSFKVKRGVRWNGWVQDEYWLYRMTDCEIYWAAEYIKLESNKTAFHSANPTPKIETKCVEKGMYLHIISTD